MSNKLPAAGSLVFFHQDPDYFTQWVDAIANKHGVVIEVDEVNYRLDILVACDIWRGIMPSPTLKVINEAR